MTLICNHLVACQGVKFVRFESKANWKRKRQKRVCLLFTSWPRRACPGEGRGGHPRKRQQACDFIFIMRTLSRLGWIPAFAGMTEEDASLRGKEKKEATGPAAAACSRNASRPAHQKAAARMLCERSWMARSRRLPAAFVVRIWLTRSAICTAASLGGSPPE